MEDKCPFCGLSDCGTRLRGTNLRGKTYHDRDEHCYETELARKDELLREAAGHIKLIKDHTSEFHYTGSIHDERPTYWSCKYCKGEGEMGQIIHIPRMDGTVCPIAKIEVFLTTLEVVKVMEEKN